MLWQTGNFCKILNPSITYKKYSLYFQLRDIISVSFSLFVLIFADIGSSANVYLSGKIIKEFPKESHIKILLKSIWFHSIFFSFIIKECRCRIFIISRGCHFIKIKWKMKNEYWPHQVRSQTEKNIVGTRKSSALVCNINIRPIVSNRKTSLHLQNFLI